jgi:hypothetical protein
VGAASSSRPPLTLPCRELVAPLPLLAVLVLVLNDWVLSPRALLPAVVTGKLSDFAGLFFFPLLLTAGWNTIRFLARRARGVDAAAVALTARQLVVATVATGVVFAVVKLWPPAALVLARALTAVTRRTAQIVPDPTDLLALVMLPLAYLHGRRAMRR